MQNSNDSEKNKYALVTIFILLAVFIGFFYVTRNKKTIDITKVKDLKTVVNESIEISKNDENFKDIKKSKKYDIINIPEPIHDESSDKNIFRFSDYGFEFSYPESWNLGKGSSAYLNGNFYTKKPGFSLLLCPEKYCQDSAFTVSIIINSTVEEVQDEFNNIEQSYQNTEDFHGLDVKAFVWGNDESEWKEIIFAKDNNVFVIGGITKDKLDYLALFQEISSSFKFNELNNS